LEFIETEQAQHNLHNTMVRQLGGHMLDAPADLPGLLEKAKETLRQAFWFGQQETMEADVARLSGLLGCGLRMVRENVTQSRPRVTDEDPRVLDRLRDLNDYDFQLWRWAGAALSKARTGHLQFQNKLRA
jgi:hypothetical protein